MKKDNTFLNHVTTHLQDKYNLTKRECNKWSALLYTHHEPVFGTSKNNAMNCDITLLQIAMCFNDQSNFKTMARYTSFLDVIPPVATSAVLSYGLVDKNHFLQNVYNTTYFDLDNIKTNDKLRKYYYSMVGFDYLKLCYTDNKTIDDMLTTSGLLQRLHANLPGHLNDKLKIFCQHNPIEDIQKFKANQYRYPILIFNNIYGIESEYLLSTINASIRSIYGTVRILYSEIEEYVARIQRLSCCKHVSINDVKESYYATGCLFLPNVLRDNTNIELYSIVANIYDTYSIPTVICSTNVLSEVSNIYQKHLIKKIDCLKSIHSLNINDTIKPELFNSVYY